MDPATHKIIIIIHFYLERELQSCFLKLAKKDRKKCIKSKKQKLYVKDPMKQVYKLSHMYPRDALY